MWTKVSSWLSPKGKTLDPELDGSLEKHTLPTHQTKFSKDTTPVSCPEFLRGGFEYEFAKLKPDLQAKIAEYQDAIQPHTDEGGEAYYIGDAYEKIVRKWADEWKVDNPGPYLRFVKSLSQTQTWHHLEYLAHWMEVSAAPPKWKFLRRSGLESRKERAERTHVCKIDYTNGHPPQQTIFTDTHNLKSALESSPQSSQEVQTRLLIVEDLSRDVVEMLGEYYDIDPLFFLSHINDYLFHNTRDRWVELPNLDIDARNRTHFSLQYLRPRYFEDEESFKTAEFQSGTFNVLRRLDSDRSRLKLQNGLLDREGASTTLIRSKTSLWFKPRVDGEPVIAILLVDPTVSKGHPLWRGNRPSGNTPSMKSYQDNPEAFAGLEHGASLFEQLVYWSGKLTEKDLAAIRADPKCISIPMLKLVLADWLTTLKYMTARLGLIEWEMEKPHWGENPSEMDALMKKLAPWRRNIGYYQAMVNETIARLFPHTLQAQFDTATQIDPMSSPVTAQIPAGFNSQMLSLWPDFKIVKQQMNDVHARIMSIQTTATNAINIEESRRAVEMNENALQQNKNLARLTFLATIFIPMNFTSSFLSMSPDFFEANKTVWLFFVLAIPITVSALIVVDLTHPDEGKSKCKKYWNKMFSTPKENSQATADPPQNLGRMTTIPWPATRNPSSYLKSRG